MVVAITHKPSPLMNQCELTFLSPQSIDSEKAASQHHTYCDTLRKCGATVVTLDRNSALPDSVFVEDTAIVLDEIAIVTPMGVASRQAETSLIDSELAKYRTVERIHMPARIEGGDILRVGRRLFVGLSSRTNSDGRKALANVVTPYGYDVIGVDVPGCLHLKTGCTAVDDQTILINPEWVDPKPFRDYRWLVVPVDEPFAANILRIGHTICMHSAFEKTQTMLRRHGYDIAVTDISEFLKAEAGMTCMSLIVTQT